jgi:hypothetical protein
VPSGQQSIGFGARRLIPALIFVFVGSAHVLIAPLATFIDQVNGHAIGQIKEV